MSLSCGLYRSAFSEQGKYGIRAADEVSMSRGWEEA